MTYTIIIIIRFSRWALKL